MLTLGLPELLHVVGYLTGATLYAMLLAMAVRSSDAGDRLTIGTALLGLAWNVGELTAHGLDRLGLSAARDWMSAASYAALGLLAAMVVHSVSRVRMRHDTRKGATASTALAWVGYSCAGVAGAMQLVAAARHTTLPSPGALVLLTSGFVALIPLLAMANRRQGHSHRALWMSALAIFAVSALHLANFHGSNESIPTELLGHHASIPLAFAILYQDYRFALADLFLKRALTLILLVLMVFLGWSALVPSFANVSPAAIGALLTLWVVTALVFPWLRRAVTAFVDRVVLARANYITFVDGLASTLQRCEAEETILAEVCQALAPALSATVVTSEPRELTASSQLAVQEIAVLTAESPQYVLTVGPLAGGRRLLSDDVRMLERAAFLAGRRIDTVRLTAERYERMLREREMRTLATEAELKALRAQINPHFLFNALTTMGYLIQSAPPRALDTLMRLTTLLRGVLRSEGEFTTLGHERELIECYLQIERERFEERLQVNIDIPADLLDTPIPSLLVQPLIENAVKHGIAPSRLGGTISVTARLDSNGEDTALIVVVRNTGMPLRGRSPRKDGGVGLMNVERRLACYYGNDATLELRTDADAATVAELRLPAADVDDLNVAIAARNAKTSA
jgi:two-component system LytT family sensor kinase